MLHCLRRIDQLGLQFLVVIRRKIHATHASTGPYPAQRYSFGAKIVLQQPVVAARFLEEHGPESREVPNANRERQFAQGFIDRTNPLFSPILCLHEQFRRRRLYQPVQELIHSSHHNRMSRKRPDDVGDPHRMLAIKSPHELLPAANDSYRHSTGNRLPIYDHVCLNVEIFLRTAWRETKSAKHLVEDQWDASGVANLAELLQPLSVGRA